MLSERAHDGAMYGHLNHGGASPRGFAHPSTKTGRYSKVWPARLAATYEAALRDPELLALNDKLALVEAPLLQLIERVDDGGGVRGLAPINDAFEALQLAVAAADKAGQDGALEALGEAIAAARQDATIWRNIFAALDVFPPLSESERKRLVEAEYMVRIDSVMHFVGAAAGILRETIKDRETIKIIQNKIQRLLEVNYGNEEP